jgi:hypothetical protein
MLAQLSTVKARLALLATDTTYDSLLSGGIAAVTARFERECRRAFARTPEASYEFPPQDAEIAVPCYPIESVTRFELKLSEISGWIVQPYVNFVIRRNCVISLSAPLNSQPSAFGLARVVYTGGYVLPGMEALPGQCSLPADLEQAAVDQVAYCFQNRDRLGLLRVWDYHSTYRHFADLDLLTGVRAVLESYTRWNA